MTPAVVRTVLSELSGSPDRAEGLGPTAELLGESKSPTLLAERVTYFPIRQGPAFPPPLAANGRAEGSIPCRGYQPGYTGRCLALKLHTIFSFRTRPAVVHPRSPPSSWLTHRS